MTPLSSGLWHEKECACFFMTQRAAETEQTMGGFNPQDVGGKLAIIYR